MEVKDMIYDSILDTIGNTPVVKLNHIAPKKQTVFVKVEAFNPMASVTSSRTAIKITRLLDCGTPYFDASKFLPTALNSYPIVV